MTTVREATFELLRARGMTTVFGNPGSTELPMLADFPEDFRYVLGLHEAVAVGMADGFAQASGRPAHVNLHTAPGVGNAMGAIFNAQANKSPLLVTAGQQARSLMTLQANLTNRDADAHAAPARQVELRAAARRGRAARARARDPPRLAAAARARCSCRSRWTTGAPRSTPRPSAHQTTRTVDGPRGRRPGGGARARRSASRRRANPVLVAGPRRSTPRGGWDAAVALAERRACRCGPHPPPAAGGSGSPRATPRSRASCRRRSGPLAETLAGHDLVLVAGSSVFPYYPNIPGPLLPEGAALVAITSDPDEAARAPMGDALVADVELTLEALLGRLGQSERDAPPARAPPSRPRTPTR